MTAIVVLAGTALAGLGTLVAHARAGGAGNHSASDLTGPTAVVVLGYPSRRNGNPHPLQRWRAELAVRTAIATSARWIVFTGGNPTRGRTEAEVMAALAVAPGLAGPDILLEDSSVSTWQNVGNTMPLVEEAASVVLVSDPLHAARARSYWLRQRPNDAERVTVTDESPLFDHWWLKVPTGIHALGRAIFDRTRR